MIPLLFVTRVDSPVSEHFRSSTVGRQTAFVPITLFLAGQGKNIIA
jgi:hypothetical protein